MVNSTAHFVTLDRAFRYYRVQGTDAQEVRRLLKEGDIHIGRPSGPGTFRVNSEGRYERIG